MKKKKSGPTKALFFLPPPFYSAPAHLSIYSKRMEEGGGEHQGHLRRLTLHVRPKRRKEGKGQREGKIDHRHFRIFLPPSSFEEGNCFSPPLPCLRLSEMFSQPTRASCVFLRQDAFPPDEQNTVFFAL